MIFSKSKHYAVYAVCHHAADKGVTRACESRYYALHVITHIYVSICQLTIRAANALDTYAF